MANRRYQTVLDAADVHADAGQRDLVYDGWDATASMWMMPGLKWELSEYCGDGAGFGERADEEDYVQPLRGGPDLPVQFSVGIQEKKFPDLSPTPYLEA